MNNINLDPRKTKFAMCAAFFINHIMQFKSL